MKPLIFFVHVPKTAGSTVNAYLLEHLPNGRSHCEAFFSDQDQLAQAAEACDWFSGHVDLGTAAASLNVVTRRPVRYFSCMRNPIRQVMSHYNWLIEIFHKGREFYEAHPQTIKEISEVIRSSQQTPSSITRNLDCFAGLFLNMQSRTILGHEFDWNTGLLHQRIGTYEMIAQSGDVTALLSRMLDKTIEGQRQENASRYHFDPSLFETDELREFLRTRNTLDEILFSLVRGGLGQ